MTGETSRAKSAEVIDSINALFAEYDIPLEKPEVTETVLQNIGTMAVNGVKSPVIADIPAPILNQG